MMHAAKPLWLAAAKGDHLSLFFLSPSPWQLRELIYQKANCFQGNNRQEQVFCLSHALNCPRISLARQ